METNKEQAAKEAWFHYEHREGNLHQNCFVNAAVNIKNYSLKNCGGHHRKKPVELPTLAGAVKQELSVKMGIIAPKKPL